MKRICLLFGTIAFVTPLFGDAFYDSLTNLAYDVVRTNVYQLVGQQRAAHTNDMVGTLLQSSMDGGFTVGGTLSNALKRVLGTGTTAASTTTNAATAATATTTNAATATTTTEAQPTVYRHPMRPKRYPIQRRQPPGRRKYPAY